MAAAPLVNKTMDINIDNRASPPCPNAIRSKSRDQAKHINEISPTEEIKFFLLKKISSTVSREICHPVALRNLPLMFQISSQNVIRLLRMTNGGSGSIFK
jgi:hypothetical protein